MNPRIVLLALLAAVLPGLARAQAVGFDRPSALATIKAASDNVAPLHESPTCR